MSSHSASSRSYFSASERLLILRGSVAILLSVGSRVRDVKWFSVALVHEPFATMALLCVRLALRISEALGPRWSDVDWLSSRLRIHRGIVEQVVAHVKTEGSARTFNLTSELLESLNACRQRSEFRADEDWIFASPLKLAGSPIPTQGCGGIWCGPRK